METVGCALNLVIIVFVQDDAISLSTSLQLVEISAFRCGVVETFGLLGCYTAYMLRNVSEERRRVP